MEKITLKLHELYTLEGELNGLINQQTGEKVTNGLLNEKLPMVTKYWLTNLARTVQQERSTIDELKNDMIKKFGVETPQGFIIPLMTDATDEHGEKIASLDEQGEAIKDDKGQPVYEKAPNPKYKEFETEFEQLMNTDKELEYRPFTLEDFEKVETGENYQVFYKLIKPS